MNAISTVILIVIWFGSNIGTYFLIDCVKFKILKRKANRKTIEEKIEDAEAKLSMYKRQLQLENYFKNKTSS